LIPLLGACGGATSTPAPPAPADACNESTAADIEVSSDEVDGFPTYASGGCKLAYVDLTGALVVRDLATNAVTTIAPAGERPRRPSISAELTAWEGTVDGVDVVRVFREGRVETIRGTFATAGEPRVHDTTIVFTAWQSSDDSDVWIYDAKTRVTSMVIGGPGQQRFADVNAVLVAATDFSEDPDGKYDRANDLADIVILDRRTNVVTRRVLPGKQGFPMLVNDGFFGYLDWNLVHPEPKLEAYRIKLGALATDPSADRTVADVKHRFFPASRPAAANGHIDWIANPEGVTSLWTFDVAAGADPKRIDGLDGLVLFAPAPAAGATFLATAPSATGARRLRVVER
jgi:hypothetical protein